MANFELTGPYIENEDTIEKNMLNVILAMMPAVIAAYIFFGPYALYLSLGTALLSTAIEFPFDQKSYSIKNPLGDGSAFLAGLLLGLTLPPGAPWWIPVLGAFLTIVIGKQVFGGIGNNIFNPALIARGILILSWAQPMTTWQEPFDGVSSATPLAEMLGETSAVTVGYWELFLGNVAGSIGETSALALLIGGLFLYINEYITWRIPVSYIVSVGVLSYFFGVDPLYAVLSGGLMFAAIFMATDMVTSPVTKDARLVYGIGCGVFTVLIRHFTVYPEGITFAILLMNGSAYIFDTVLEGPRFGEVEKRKQTFKRWGSVVLASILFLALTYGATLVVQNLAADVEEGFPLADGVYTGRGEGAYGDIELEINISSGELISIEVLNHQETENIADPAFETLINRVLEQQRLDVESVSGATLTSQGFIAALENALDTEETEKQLTTVTGTGGGMNDDIVVEVQLEGDKITAIEVIEHSETEDIAGPAFAELIESVLAAQSTDVDTVSGATMSSEGFLEAVNDALEKAGVEISGTAEKTEAERIAGEDDVDIDPDAETEATEEPEESESLLTGQGAGMNDNIVVEVKLEGDEITVLEVIEHSETEDIAGPAFAELIESVLAAQSTDVDTVSGATMSSEGFLEAVNDALEEANYE